MAANVSQVEGGTTTPVKYVPATKTAVASVATAHQMVVAVGIIGAFIAFMVVLAGTSPRVGHACVAFMFCLILVQGITHVNPFVEWTQKHPLTPVRK